MPQAVCWIQASASQSQAAATASYDTNNIGPLNGQCAQYDSLFTGGTLKCTSQCKLDTTQCFGTSGNCGNSVINIGESCDGSDFGNITDCVDYSSFAGGLLKCNNCKLDTSSCVPKQKCGNGVIDSAEACDTSTFGSINDSCKSYSSFFTSGVLKCTNDCKLDTFSCNEAPKCGNGAIDSGETCDGTNFGNITDISCSSHGANFVEGTLACKSCKINTDNCKSNISSTITITCKDRGDCKAGEQCNDNSNCATKFCSDSRCIEPTCDDGIKNQEETSIDCGGPCNKCPNGKNCNLDSDCTSSFCSIGVCNQKDTCLDGKLSPGESAVDCGGNCPIKCSEGVICDSTQDCKDGLQCVSSQCKKCTDEDENCNDIPDEQEEKDTKGTTSKDSDGDGIPDDWEIQNGLNPNDPNDAALDFDGDGLTNFEEFDIQKVYGKSTNPNSADTDNDNFADKKEIDKGTSPVDPEDFPKSSLAKIIVVILGIAILISGFGYLAYNATQRRKKGEFKIPLQPIQKDFQKITPELQVKQESPKQKIEKIKIGEMLRKREELRAKEREALFGTFQKETGVAPKEETKEIPEKPELRKVDELGKEIKKEPKAQFKGDALEKLAKVAIDHKQKDKSKRQSKPKAKHGKLEKLYELAKSKTKKTKK
ncbi:hypothetical protein HYY70_04330 [Candidatus Woesearchaeota archaeon]|nr:hypothetical protein [Candidatus Woesearchaeota archaeon]